ASWITLYITLTGRVDGDGNPLPDLTFYNGVFVNVEHRDKQWLENHGLWLDGQTWLYKYSDPYSPDIKEGPDGDSPAYQALLFKPFQECKKPRDCNTQPTGQDFVDTLNQWINMEGMLAFAATSAFHISPDDLFSKGKNFYFVDYSQTVDTPREYIEWDLDAAYQGMDYTADIYDVGARKFGVYEDWIVDDGTFKAEYTEIMQRLLDGPLNETDINDALSDFEALLGDALAADPHNALGDPVPEYFSDFRTWHSNRIASVLSQLPSTPPEPGNPETALYVGALAGESAPAPKNRWDATVTITVFVDPESPDTPFEAATVSSDWGSCETDDSGTCQISKNNIKSNVASATFTVADITADGMWYDADANAVTSVTIYKP
ncbi:MAG: CotH kinase family protein, partial [Chloroflexota bacterium]|nr:CotH kinase family protein [Chloroflexota bacterium]